MNLLGLKKLVFALILFASASTTYAQFQIFSVEKTFEQERAEVSLEHPKIVAQFGGEAGDPELRAYVSRVGQIVARNSEMPDKPFKFTVLNASEPNAFTVGGGYIYITRGLLGLMNSEAELVGVLGHEAGHVTARHSVRRQARMQRKQYENGILALLTGNLLLVGAKELTDSSSMLSYSRKQERQADNLGFKTLNKAGYDVDGMTDMLSSLQRFVRLQSTLSGREGAAEPPAWLSDHPATDERIRNMSIRAGIAKLTAPNQTRKNSKQYLEAIDGLMYGEDPAQGTVRNGVFYHTGMGFSFKVPYGVQIQNQPQAVIGVKGEKLVMLFGGMEWPSDRSLEDYASQIWMDATRGTVRPELNTEKLEINGLQALQAKKTVIVRSILENASVSFNTFVYRLDDKTVMHMAFAMLSQDAAANGPTIETMAKSFGKLTEEQKAEARPYKVVMVDVGPKDNLGTMADKMAFKSFKLARFKMLNAIETNEQLRSRSRVKIVVQQD